MISIGFPAAAKKKKSKRAAAATAIIAGTVFQDTGFSLRGAEIIVADSADPKFRAAAIADSRGEFAVRVPQGRATYVVTARAKGFRAGQKTVEIYEGEKATVSIMLQRE